MRTHSDTTVAQSGLNMRQTARFQTGDSIQSEVHGSWFVARGSSSFEAGKGMMHADGTIGWLQVTACCESGICGV
ncbi:hypothetical protein PAAG_08078 [Paracoccidioides lutzii Pb01]|uniref:Uncharacterized protein n=1 Tax=Paracoccidioides lutzii (strain ATCC MYA-826 / Pb01) TaxID=502779 RepID=C1HBD7_PARBA|nr:hypothetical protein PAAG_08078 [Paracoccidioides lutzii Pb01]EEH37660.2 hypothetical protein PAAG_08078 [Paracoccidioides lutzii Pb01]